jgi:hypothetical protein
MKPALQAIVLVFVALTIWIAAPIAGAILGVFGAFWIIWQLMAYDPKKDLGQDT